MELFLDSPTMPKFIPSYIGIKNSKGPLLKSLPIFKFQIQNGATFVKVDKINIMKDNSPALLFQGIGIMLLISFSSIANLK